MEVGYVLDPGGEVGNDAHLSTIESLLCHLFTFDSIRPTFLAKHTCSLVTLCSTSFSAKVGQAQLDTSPAVTSFADGRKKKNGEGNIASFHLLVKRRKVFYAFNPLYHSPASNHPQKRGGVREDR
jgi:hypothetical protein